MEVGCFAMQDKFYEYLGDQSRPTRQRALTASSYKNIDHSLEDADTNSELATYGDALLKLAFCKILFDKDVSNITVEKQKYEPDKVFVEIIAQHYELLNYIRFDESNNNIPQDYGYRESSKKGKDSPSKYIATAVEALIAAFYLDNKEDFSLVVEIAKHWIELIDSALITL
jgi:dsRNA-specific ribonuclease